MRRRPILVVVVSALACVGALSLRAAEKTTRKLSSAEREARSATPGAGVLPEPVLGQVFFTLHAAAPGVPGAAVGVGAWSGRDYFALGLAATA